MTDFIYIGIIIFFLPLAGFTSGSAKNFNYGKHHRRHYFRVALYLFVGGNAPS